MVFTLREDMTPMTTLEGHLEHLHFGELPKCRILMCLACTVKKGDEPLRRPTSCGSGPVRTFMTKYKKFKNSLRWMELDESGLLIPPVIEGWSPLFSCSGWLDGYRVLITEGQRVSLLLLKYSSALLWDSSALMV